MSSYFITGKLGSGKTLVSVGRIFDYLRQGRRVATNLDLHLENYCKRDSRLTYLRLPDKPTVFDLNVMGSGNESPDEEKNGLLVLDELGSWFNSRGWQDKARAPLLDWFIHARKHGWDLLLIVQDIDMVDAQLRGMLGEHLVICKRMDRLRIPFVGWLLKWMGFKGALPKVHSARVHYGESVADMVVDRWFYQGKDLYSAYDTKQVFSPLYDKGVFSRLSTWHTTGRYLAPVLSAKEKLQLWFQQGLGLHVVPRDVSRLKPKNALVARIMKLPVHRRVEFFQRFEACGAFA